MRIVCNDGDTSFAFADPIRVLRADRLDDVFGVLEDADRALVAGNFVAGYVTYEAGAAFVPKQRVPPRGTLPFAEIGVYRAPHVCTPEANDSREAPDGFSIGPLVPRCSRSAYDAAIATILSRIEDGDVYQVNLAAPFTFAVTGDTRELYDELIRGGAYPHTAYVETEHYAIVSCSPELFVRFEGKRLVTKPMKGTASDDDLAALGIAKNRAEHIMIVDLLRNDLHRIASDVAVEGLGEVERYPRYATMTSTIVATRAERFNLSETFEAMFPCGSITGAPKVTAMQTIAELEGERGAFCGSIGYRAPDHSGSWNVAIRTATIDRHAGRGTLHVGGGIVADSNSEDEWAEILVKRRFFDRVAPPHALIETLYRETDGTYRNREAHVSRLVASADALHFRCDTIAVASALDAFDGYGELVHLELVQSGNLMLRSRPLEPVETPTIVWSTQTVDPREPLQRHKTTWRPHYDRATIDARDRGAFDAILGTRDGFVADGARTNLFIGTADGMKLETPPVSDGALPGVLRDRLLRTGIARERRLRREDVEGAAAIFVGNSARGLMRATLEAARAS